MMRSFTLFLAVCACSLVTSAQNVPIDFENGGFGANWTWTVFENDVNPPLEIVANPDQTGANTSATVAKFTALQAGQPYAGCESMHGSDIGFFTLDASTSTATIMVWKTEISDVGIKLVAEDGWSLGEIKVANTQVNQWEKLTFDLSPLEGVEYDQIVIFPDFHARGQDNIIYFDNVTFGNIVASNPPAVAAPDPTINENLVISMFSDVYTDVTVDTWEAVWSMGTVEDVMIDNNPTKVYRNLDFAGIEAVGPNVIDASLMEVFHVDLWSENATEFRIKLVDFGADGEFGGNDDTEHEIIETPVASQWNSYAIDLADFTGLTAREHIAQVVLSASPAGDAIVYMDNMYFSRALGTGIADEVQSNTRFFPNPASDWFRIEATGTIERLEIYSVLGTLVHSSGHASNTATIDLSTLEAGSYLVKATVAGSGEVHHIVIQ